MWVGIFLICFCKYLEKKIVIVVQIFLENGWGEGEGEVRGGGISANRLGSFWRRRLGRVGKLCEINSKVFNITL